jgi:hypothetical protein
MSTVWVAISIAILAAQASAENLLLKRSDGSTITSIPLQTSNGCAVVGDGDIEVRPLSAEGAIGDGWCQDGDAPPPPRFFSGVGGSPLSVTPISLPSGGGTVFATWTAVSATPMTCTGTATRDATGVSVPGWSGPRAASQSAPGLAIAISEAGNYIFFITCTNATGSTTSSSLTVHVSDIGANPCWGVSPDFGLIRQITMVNTDFLQGNSEHPNGPLPVRQFNVIAGPWPARTQNGTIAILPNRFVALEFNTGTVSQATYGGTVNNPNRFGTIETAQASANNGQVLLAISKCPGSFQFLPQSNPLCRFSGGQGVWPWGVGVFDPFACRLEENTTYYLNAAYVDFNSQQSSCTNPEPITGTNAGSCHWFAQPR